MKKILGILLLAVLLIFAAGCITTVEEDAVVGTWVDTREHESYTLELYPNGEGMSQGTYTYSGEEESYIFPVWWSTDGEGTYLTEEIYSIRLFDDGTMRDYTGASYELTDAEANIWTETPKGDIYSVYQFNTDGTGSETICDINGNAYVIPLIWKEHKDDILLYWYTTPYTSTDDSLLIGDTEYTFTSAGTFVNHTETSTESFIFYVGGICIKTLSWGDNGAKDVTYYTWVEDNGSGYQIEYDRIVGLKQVSTTIESGYLVERYVCTYSTEDNGTLVCQEHESVLTKTE